MTLPPECPSLTPLPAVAGTAAIVPSYLMQTYRWAYLDQRTLPWLDRPSVVSAILWGNAGRLMRGAVAEFEPGQKVMQAACVYGDFSRLLAERVGRSGALEVVDVAPLQLANAQRKLAGLPQVRLRCEDLALARDEGATPAYDGVCCFFLLHEVPEQARQLIVDRLLAMVRPGGKVVFVDYHQPARWHPLAPLMAAIFRWLEPFAPSLLTQSLEILSPRAGQFDWHKRTLFGGLYQHVVAVRRV